MTNPEAVKDQFYDALIAVVPKSEKLLIFADFSARVGTDRRRTRNFFSRRVPTESLSSLVG